MTASDLIPGDLIYSEDAYWEIIKATTNDEHVLFPGVTTVGGRYVRDGKTVSFAVEGLLRRDYHEVIPSDIVKAWRLVN